MREEPRMWLYNVKGFQTVWTVVILLSNCTGVSAEVTEVAVTAKMKYVGTHHCFLLILCVGWSSCTHTCEKACSHRHSILNSSAGIVFAVAVLECEVTTDGLQDWRELEEKSQNVYWDEDRGSAGDDLLLEQINHILTDTNFPLVKLAN